MVNHSDMKLGKGPRSTDTRALHMARYVDISIIPEPPADIDNSRGVTEWEMMMNDRLGCCTVAGLGHAIQTAVLSQTDPGTSPRVIRPDDDTIIGGYRDLCGYIPGDASTDVGGVLNDVLKRARKIGGLEGRKVRAFVSVDSNDLHQMQIAAWLFNGLYTGVRLPLAWQGQKTWDLVTGKGGTPNSWGPHCIWVPNSKRGFKELVSWGEMYTITDRAVSQYVDETWAILLDDQRPVKGFDMEMLEHDIRFVSR